MPTYEYRCEDCGDCFEVRATIAEKTAGLDLACEKCGSKKLEQIFSGFSLITSRKVNGRTGDDGGCCGTGEPC